MCSRAASDEISSGVTLNLRGWQNPVTRSELAWERCRRFSRHENSVSPLFFQWTSKTFVTPWDLLHKEGYQTWNNGEANKTKAYFLRTGEKKKLIKNTKKGSRIFIPFSFLPHVLSLSKWIENPLSLLRFSTETVPLSCECTNNIPCRWQSVILTRTSKCALRTAEHIDPSVFNKSL